MEPICDESCLLLSFSKVTNHFHSCDGLLSHYIIYIYIGMFRALPFLFFICIDEDFPSEPILLFHLASRARSLQILYSLSLRPDQARLARHLRNSLSFLLFCRYKLVHLANKHDVYEKAVVDYRLTKEI